MSKYRKQMELIVKENIEKRVEEIVEDIKDIMLKEAILCNESFTYSINKNISPMVIVKISRVLTEDGFTVLISQSDIPGFKDIKISWEVPF